LLFGVLNYAGLPLFAILFYFFRRPIMKSRRSAKGFCTVFKWDLALIGLPEHHLHIRSLLSAPLPCDVAVTVPALPCDAATLPCDVAVTVPALPDRKLC
jgi:hypothetical protein